LDVFVFCPFTRTSIRPVDAGIQDILPFVITLISRSTWNEHSNCDRIRQLAVFICCPFTGTSIRSTDAGIQDILPSAFTLIYRSTWDQRDDSGPILATVYLYRILHFVIFL
jgi:hypothetical protein